MCERVGDCVREAGAMQAHHGDKERRRGRRRSRRRRTRNPNPRALIPC